jgi:hypothetical protein
MTAQMIIIRRIIHQQEEAKLTHLKFEHIDPSGTIAGSEKEQETKASHDRIIIGGYWKTRAIPTNRPKSAKIRPKIMISPPQLSIWDE